MMKNCNIFVRIFENTFRIERQRLFARDQLRVAVHSTIGEGERKKNARPMRQQWSHQWPSHRHMTVCISFDLCPVLVDEMSAKLAICRTKTTNTYINNTKETASRTFFCASLSTSSIFRYVSTSERHWCQSLAAVKSNSFICNSLFKHFYRTRVAGRHDAFCIRLSCRRRK